MAAYQPSPVAPFLKGVVASNQPLAEPKGAIARGSNLVMIERGALTPCDGSAIINYFGGAVQNNRGRMEALFLYDPIGVVPYYLALIQNSNLHLGAPQNLVVTGTGSGSLPAGTYYYEVTALDGAGGETPATNEVSHAVGANGSITLKWNTVPNAWAYNVYRATVSGGEMVLSGPCLPVPQTNPITDTISYTDGGSCAASPFPPLGISVLSMSSGGSDSATVILPTGAASNFYAGKSVTVTGNSNAGFNGSFKVFSIISDFAIVVTASSKFPKGGGTGGTITDPGPPVSDNTGQVGLYEMPSGTIPISYTDANVVALFPNCPPALGVAPSGGSVNLLGIPSSTPSGGIQGMTSLIPQFKQFTNRGIIGLGNGFNPQVFWDSTGSKVNPAPNGAITGVTVDSHGQVTVTTSATLSTTDPTKVGFMPPGTNVILSGISNNIYNGTFVVVSVSTNSFIVVNLAAIGQSSSSGGTWTDTTTPIISTFTPAYPAWATVTAYPTGSIIVPMEQPSNAVYLTAIQGGTTGSSEPSWPDPATLNQAFPLGNIADGSVIWQETGYLNSAAPPPPGAGHIEVYANSLWVLNTFCSDVTSTGLDGPCALRMSGQGNPFSWNPVNQAFLDKDDGFEGMGLAKFTITALGIPPEGSLIAFKNSVPYQIIGVFGSTNFAIQTVQSNMGCVAPRTIQFVPGFGITRYSHLGISLFDGVRDTLISEQIRPYLFATNDLDALDISPVDQQWVAISACALTANPPMYCCAVPIGNSGGQLTRIFCYDLVLKGWAIEDLPFGISSMAQAQSQSTFPITLLGGYLDGCLQRWQAGDIQWYVGGGSFVISVTWALRTLTIASQNSDQRMYARRLVLRGTNSGAAGVITVQIRRSVVSQQAIAFPINATSDFDVFVDINLTGLRFDAFITSTAHTELDGLTWHIEPRPVGVPVAAI